MAGILLSDGRTEELSIEEQTNPELYTLAYVKAAYRITKEIEECPWVETTYVAQTDINENPISYHETSMEKVKKHELYTGNPATGGVLIKTINYTYPGEYKMTHQVIVA